MNLLKEFYDKFTFQFIFLDNQMVESMILGRVYSTLLHPWDDFHWLYSINLSVELKKNSSIQCIVTCFQLSLHTLESLTSKFRPHKHFNPANRNINNTCKLHGTKWHDRLLLDHKSINSWHNTVQRVWLKESRDPFKLVGDGWIYSKKSNNKCLLIFSLLFL